MDASLSYTDLLALAKRGATIYWPRSGLVEALSTHTKRIYARPLAQPKEHLLAYPSKRGAWYCREVSGEERAALKAAMVAKRRMKEIVAPHADCGRGTAETGPDHTDCAHRATTQQDACAAAGCGFCRAATCR